MSDAAVSPEWGESAHRFANSTVLCAVVAAIVVLPIAVAAVDRLPAGVFQDDGMYMILAKSLATGHGYRWINLPGEPRASHFPPGYPAFLALLWRIGPAFPANVAFFKLVNAVLLAASASIVAVYARLRLSLSSPAAALVAIVGCASVPVLVLSNLVMSETLFFTLLMLSILYAEWTLAREMTSDLQAVGLAAVGGLLMLVRSHGIAFVAAVGVALLLRRRFRALAIYLVGVVLAAYPWHHWQAVHSGLVPIAMRGEYESYGNWFFTGSAAHSIAFVGQTIAATSRELFAMLLVIATSGVPVLWLRFFGAIVALALIVLGLVSLWRRAIVTTLFMCIFFAIMLVWPFTPARFVWAVWPLIVVVFVAGAVAVKDWRASEIQMNVARALAAAGVLIALFGYGTYNLRGYSGRWWSSIGRSTVGVVGPTITWIARNTPAKALVASNAEVMIYLYTGRLAVPATSLLPDDYFRLPSVQSRSDALRSILQAYRVDAVAIVANDSLEIAARQMTAGQAPSLMLRDNVPNGLIFLPTHR